MRLSTSTAWGAGLNYTNLPALKVDDVVRNVQEKLLPTSKMNEVVRIEGSGQHFGLSGQWTLNIGPNGAFTESFTGEKITSSWGSSGLPKLLCWEMDYSGICREMELDDHESCLLTTWLRSGQWLHPAVLDILDVEITNESTAGVSHKAGNEESISGRNTSARENKDKVRLPTQTECDPSTTLCLSIKFKSGKVKVAFLVDRDTWLPVRMSQDLFGDRETWRFSKWQLWGNSKLPYPSAIVHTASSGGRHEYMTHKGKSLTPQRHAFSDSSPFAPPPFSLLPPNYEFDSSVSNKIPAWKTTSCHVLVKPLINNEDIGYMILDTGASGLVIEKSAADLLGLDVFGELYVSGVSGKVAAHFRRAKTLQLGPLTLKNPQFMEMPVPGLVADLFQPIVGIVGYDIFRRSVVEMKPKTDADKDIPAKGQSNFDVTLYDLEAFPDLPDFKSLKWSHLQMITNLPHIRTKFSTGGDVVHDALFMVDTGAGGALVMFMSRAAEEFKLENNLRPNAKTFVKGVGGSQTERLPVKSSNLSWFKFHRTKLEDISCLFIDGSKMDISLYASGIICMNSLQDKRLLIDYARQRMAVIQLGEAESEEHIC